jgi:hypothetical protein
MKNKTLLLSLATIVAITFSCKKDSDSGSESVIPADPGTSVPTTTVNNLSSSIANPAFNTSGSTVTMVLSGIKDPKTGSFIKFAGTGSGQNIWIEEDGVNKGLLVQSAASAKKSTSSGVPADIVFVVDNSGSMYEEADSIASQISSFGKYLQDNGLDVKVACVGYDEEGLPNGALNFTTVANLKKYLNRTDIYYGTDRTVGFSGTDSATLEQKAEAMIYDGSENAIPSIMFSDANFSWRSGAIKIYISFTDEPIQPSFYGSSQLYDLAHFYSSWTSSKGTVHSVFSLDDWNGTDPDTANVYTWNTTTDVRPWKLAEYTGGSIMFFHSDGSDLDLTKIQVTEALANTYVLKFNSASISGTHDLKIVVKTINNASDGLKQLNDIKYK